MQSIDRIVCLQGSLLVLRSLQKRVVAFRLRHLVSELLTFS